MLIIYTLDKNLKSSKKNFYLNLNEKQVYKLFESEKAGLFYFDLPDM